MRHFLTAGIFGSLLLTISCGNTESGPHATVVTRDGTRLSGTITQNSPSKLTLLADDKSAHEIPADQIKSVVYGATSPGAADTTHDDHYHPPQAVIHTKTYNLNAGAKIPVRIEETIDSGKAVEGQTYAAEVTQAIGDGAGETVIPRGSNAVVAIISASRGGRFRGAADLQLDLVSVSVEGQKYRVEAESIGKRGRDGVGANKRTAIFGGGGGGIGAIIGAIAGGGKGAAIGAASGAGAGVLTQVLTKGGSIRVPAETVLTFQLDRPLHVVAAR